MIKTSCTQSSFGDDFLKSVNLFFLIKAARSSFLRLKTIEVNSDFFVALLFSAKSFHFLKIMSTSRKNLNVKMRILF